ncbi:biotin biosynthesis protein BioC [Legionella birminghamensis]|uniref:Biotin biosynthesis protein BioC n=1 Tax=Legionella birminghamensis TaxID=28083 RepID=A0A378I9Q2_9GAMM|nr:class I SAM-dependent methyltransferase [Legionella birminghamensis]KTC74702.1 biotin biosynthesis protein BioC [Legionella birminghamensis]STX31505.1 biotin biosynthesis protein BioC [Legionella birminghamensis]
MTDRNHFDSNSEQYREYRPQYPDSLYTFLLEKTPQHNTVWDCATGNGQAALPWINRFKHIIATDISQSQLDQAFQSAAIEYRCCPAENSGIDAHSVDLITVAQALHWFNFDLFYEEVRRVAKPSAIFAAWCYSLGQINCNLDIIIKNLYENILGERYWAWQRKFIDEHYASIPFPFKKIETPLFFIEKEFDLAGFKGYLNTWSAVKEYQLKNKTNPVELISDELTLAWGAPDQIRLMQWPVSLLAGHVE